EKLIAPALRAQGAAVRHILADGELDEGAQLALWQQSPPYRPGFATLYTIGMAGRSLRSFVETLRAAGVDCVIDTRLRPDSHLAGYARRVHLEYLLTALAGID